MKKCLRCGNEYPDNLNTCPLDGESLASSTAGATPPTFPANVQILADPPASGLSITSLILGIMSLFCGLFLGIPAVICGHLGLNKANKNPATVGGKGIAIGGLVTGYAGIFIGSIWLAAFMAGLLIPAFAKAKQKAESIHCMNNLKQVSVASAIWADEHQGRLPDSFLQMSNELSNPRILTCPADPNHHSSTNWDSDNISYEFLAPGSKISPAGGQVIFRCPIHGNEAMSDGSVIPGSKIGNGIRKRRAP